MPHLKDRPLALAFTKDMGWNRTFSPAYYFTFSPKAFRSPGLISGWENRYEFRSVWNFFYKTLFWGEFRYPTGTDRVYKIMTVIQLVFLGLLLIGIIVSVRYSLKRINFFLLLLAVFMLYPLVSIISTQSILFAEARYIFPVIIPIIYFIIQGIRQTSIAMVGGFRLSRALFVASKTKYIKIRFPLLKRGTLNCLFLFFIYFYVLCFLVFAMHFIQKH